MLSAVDPQNTTKEESSSNEYASIEIWKEACRKAVDMTADMTKDTYQPTAFESYLLWALPPHLYVEFLSLSNRTKPFLLVANRDENEQEMCLAIGEKSVLNVPHGDQEEAVEKSTTHPLNHLKPIPRDDARFLLSLHNASGLHDIDIGIISLSPDSTTNLRILLPYSVSGSQSRAAILDLSPAVSLSSISIFKEKVHRVLAYNETHDEPIFQAEYDILSESILASSENRESCTIKVQFEWQKTFCRILQAPVNPSHAIIEVKYVPGDIDEENHPHTQDFRHQLQRLKEWIQVVGESTWITANSGDGPMLSAAVDAFITDIKSENRKSFPRLATSVAATKTDNPIEQQLLLERIDLDFTERLWNFVQAPTTDTDLKDALIAIVEELETGRLVPFVHRDNRTNMGSVIRNLLKLHHQKTSSDWNEQKEAIGYMFDNWLEAPLEILIEVGIWKLSRDVLHEFHKRHIPVWKETETLLESATSPEHQVEILSGLLRVLELILLLESNFVNISETVLLQFAKSALVHLQRSLQDEESKLTNGTSLTYRHRINQYTPQLSILSKGVASSEIRPSSWRMQIFSKQINRKMEEVNSWPTFSIQLKEHDLLRNDLVDLGKNGQLGTIGDLSSSSLRAFLEITTKMSSQNNSNSDLHKITISDVFHNEPASRFEYTFQRTSSTTDSPRSTRSNLAYLEYILHPQNAPPYKEIEFTHTFVPPMYRGQGVAQALVEAGRLYAVRNQWGIIPTCTYVAKVLRSKV